LSASDALPTFTVEKALRMDAVLGLVCEMLERFGGRITELEAVVREIAIDTTTGTVVDRLPADQVWEKTGPKVKMVRDLINELREYLYVLKPEKVPTIQGRVTSIIEHLDLFEESLTVEGGEADSTQISIDELRKALGEISEFVSLCRAFKEEPSEIIKTILDLRENQRTDTVPVTPSKMMRLGELVKNVQSSYEDTAELTAKMGRQLSAVKAEYDELYFSLNRKEEDKEE